MKAPRWLFRALIVLALLLCAQLVVLARLDYSTSRLEWAPLRDTSISPTRAASIGALRWDYRTYRTAPQLEPLRAYYRSTCNGKVGVAAALALTQRLASESPFGEQRHEFLANRFNPAAELAAMSHGGTSHCVNRSAIVSAILLSVGIPARVVQLIPEKGPGHNVVEVWDEQGWLLVDPSTGGLITDGRGPCSAAQAILSPERVNLVPKVRSAMGARASAEMYRTHGFFEGQIVYPEPWLYTRVGPRVAIWPFRGAFAVAGARHWLYGPAQTSLQVGSGACVLVMLLLPFLAAPLRRAPAKLRRIAQVLREPDDPAPAAKRPAVRPGGRGESL